MKIEELGNLEDPVQGIRAIETCYFKLNGCICKGLRERLRKRLFMVETSKPRWANTGSQLVYLGGQGSKVLLEVLLILKDEAEGVV